MIDHILAQHWLQHFCNRKTLVVIFNMMTIEEKGLINTDKKTHAFLQFLHSLIVIIQY